MKITPMSQQAKDAAMKFLRANLVAAVSTVCENGEPHVAFMYYAVNADFTMYVVTKRDTQKCRNMQRTHRAAVAVGDEAKVRAMQAVMEAEELTDAGEIEQRTGEIFRSPLLAKAYLGEQPLKFLPPANMDGEARFFAVFALRPLQVRLLRREKETGEAEFVEVIARTS